MFYAFLLSISISDQYRFNQKLSLKKYLEKWQGPTKQEADNEQHPKSHPTYAHLYKPQTKFEINTSIRSRNNCEEIRMDILTNGQDDTNISTTH